MSRLARWIGFAAAVCASGAITGYTADSKAKAAGDEQGDSLHAKSTVNPVVQWNKMLLELIRTPGLQPPTLHSTRSFAMMHTAIYDAVNLIEPSHQPYLTGLEAPASPASRDAAATSAAHTILSALYPAQKVKLDAALQQSLAEIPTKGDRVENGLRLGRGLAERMLAQRANDQASSPVIPFAFESTPGRYQSTPPNLPAQPTFTHWPKVLPFVLKRGNQFRPGPPPKLLGPEYAQDVNEIKALGAAASTTRSTDQTVIGRFWGGPIQNYWNEIAQTAVQQEHLGTARSAHVFALLNLTLADAAIAFYDAKYTHVLWRPVTAIRGAEGDGNAATTADANWLPLAGNSPAYPSYPGALVLAGYGGYSWGARSVDHQRLVAELASAHIRVLLTGHAHDVVSSDRHTLKPWLVGKLDFAPSVRDFSGEGFPLLGARLDRISDENAGVLVYQRRKHWIDLFLWRGGPDVAVGVSIHAGFNIIVWKEDGIHYGVVSDLGVRELEDFCRLVQMQAR